MLEHDNANDNGELKGYAAINAAWGCDPKTLRKLTDNEALKVARLLVREGYKAFGDGKKPFAYKYKTAPRINCYTRSHGRKFYVNKDRRGEGIAEMIHDISHWVHRRVHPKWGGHNGHAIVELHLIEFAIKRKFIA